MRLSLRATFPALAAALLAACSSGGGPSGPPTITVSGQLVDGYRNPLPYAAVLVGDRPPAFTDLDGRFTVEGVTAPYDATALFAGTYMLTYVGLTRSDPTLHWVGFSGGASGLCRAYLRGTVASYMAGTDVMVALASTPATQAYQRATWTAGDSWEFRLYPYWYGEDTIPGTVHALGRGSDPDTGQRTWWGASAEISLEDGNYQSEPIALTLAPLPLDTVSGTVTPFAEAGAVYKSLTVRYPGVTFQSEASYDGTTEFTFTVPSGAGATFDVTATAFQPSGGRVESRALGLPAGTAGVALAMADPPALVSPADGATGVTTDTPLTWTPFAESVHVVTAWGEDYAPYHMIVTQGSSVTLPDLRAYGIELRRSTAYTWSVEGYAPFDTVDEVAGEARLDDWVQRGAATSWTFTTAP